MLGDADVLAFIQVRQHWTDEITGLEELIRSPEYSEEFKIAMLQYLGHKREAGKVLAQIAQRADHE